MERSFFTDYSDDKSQSKMKVNKFTLSFPDENEKNYQAAYFANSIVQFRMSFVLVILLYGIFGYLDNVVIEEHAFLFHVVRFGVVIPLTSLVLLLSFAKNFSKIWQELIFLCYIIGGIGIIIMLLEAPYNYSYYGGLMLVFMAGYFFIGLRFLYAAIGGWFILIIFNIGAIFFSNTESQIVISNNFFFISANLIGMFAAYIMEFYRRRGFFLNQQLDFRNEEIKIAYVNLESKVEERTKELKLAIEKVVESENLKSAFLANMSHEIRTPLNSIIGFSELLNDPDFEQEQKEEFITTIVDSGKNLMIIINDIMDLSMLDSRQIKIRPEQFSAKKLLEDLEKEFKPKAQDNGIEFLIHIPTEVEILVIENDIYRIRQIMNNFIGNAFKFTTEGFIEIGCKLNGKYADFYVKDTGIGIAPDNYSAVFERFRQLDSAKTRKYGGNGLGLSISKNLGEMLGGKVWLESEVGKGSTFYFTIPYKEDV